MGSEGLRYAHTRARAHTATHLASSSTTVWSYLITLSKFSRMPSDPASGRFGTRRFVLYSVSVEVSAGKAPYSAVPYVFTQQS